MKLDYSIYSFADNSNNIMRLNRVNQNGKSVAHSHADAVITITNTRDGEARIREIYGDRVLIVPYVMPGFLLAKKVFQLTEQTDWGQYEGMVLMNHGLFTFGNDARRGYERTLKA